MVRKLKANIVMFRQKKTIIQCSFSSFSLLVQFADLKVSAALESSRGRVQSPHTSAPLCTAHPRDTITCQPCVIWRVHVAFEGCQRSFSGRPSRPVSTLMTSRWRHHFSTSYERGFSIPIGYAKPNWTIGPRSWGTCPPPAFVSTDVIGRRRG